jgi:cell fate regulator YaaT (PSP1 superfamily)
MPVVVGVAFRPVTKIYYFDPAGVEDLAAGEYVVVETSRGRTLGTVALTPRAVGTDEISGMLKPVVRRATAWDMVQNDQMMHREPEALAICKQRAAALRMDIKVVKVEFSFDGASAVVYFTSEQRVDFRNLVHELSQSLRTRVEMRQVGVRDEAKFIGGFGKCGRELCCVSWLREFTPVSIKMAKAQDLPLNAPEVSGLCGRLLCCLSYENDFYTEARKQMPRINSMIETPQGVGKVRQVHVLANSISVLVEGPNDSRQMVDMVVPEPEVNLNARQHNEGIVATSEALEGLAEAPLTTEDVDVTRAAGEPPAEPVSAEGERPVGSGPRVTPGGEGPTGPRRPRSRRRKRT